VSADADALPDMLARSKLTALRDRLAGRRLTKGFKHFAEHRNNALNAVDNSLLSTRRGNRGRFPGEVVALRALA